jgi:chromosome condensin MukBEF ATPase and DNA-binding subunit MukB
LILKFINYTTKLRYNFQKGVKMFKDIIKKITEWALEKEEEAAKNCAIPLEEIDRQLQILEEKRDELKKKCEEELNELENLIERIKKIKSTELLKCNAKKD